MLTIRLRRIGKRQHATFRFIVMEKSRSPQSRAVEFVGSYDPHTDPPTVNLKRDRVEHWLKVGAQPSATVHNILVDAGLVTGPKVKVAKPKKKVEETSATEAKPAAAAKTETTEAPAKKEEAAAPAESAAPVAEAKAEEKKAEAKPEAKVEEKKTDLPAGRQEAPAAGVKAETPDQVPATKSEPQPDKTPAAAKT